MVLSKSWVVYIYKLYISVYIDIVHKNTISYNINDETNDQIYISTRVFSVNVLYLLTKIHFVII
jgi:hypothetical protein